MNYLKSPMNYIGNKYRLLEQIIPLLPQSNNFVDLFAGGLDVSINYKANQIFCNDINYHLIEIYKAFQTIEYSDLIYRFEQTIQKFELNKTNTTGYINFREHYNSSANKDPLDLYLLMNYGFNYQLRFNSKHEFNNPFGKNRSSFNNTIRTRLATFMNLIKDYKFSSCDFRMFDFSILKEGDLIYCDPPYTISVGSYNDGKRGFTGWQKQDDIDLIKILDNLSERGIHFALSNVLTHKGETNSILSEWSTKYTVHELNCSYSNSSYNLTSRTCDTREVLITNE